MNKENLYLIRAKLPQIKKKILLKWREEMLSLEAYYNLQNNM